MAKGRDSFTWQLKFSLILGGQAFSLIGSGLVQFSIIWWLTRETDSTVILSLAAITGLVPVILLSPLAGVVADRINRRLVMIMSDAFIALATLVMAVLMSLGYRPIWLIFVLLFLRAAGSAFHQPAFEAAIPLIAPEIHLVRTAAVTQILRSAISFLAPLLGALLIEWLPLAQILLIDVVSAGIAILLLLPAPIPSVSQSDGLRHPLAGYLQDMKIGIQYVLRWKGLLALIIVFGLSNFLLAPVLSMMPLIITRHFNGGAREYGFFEMALAIGVIAGSLSLSIWGGFKRKIVSINIAQIVCGLGLAGIALVASDSFWVVLVLIALCGLCSAYINSPATAIMQAKVDKEMQGRVMSIVTVVCMVAMPLSLAIAGPLANVIGLMPIVYIPGLISTLIGIACFLIKPLMNIENRRVSKPVPTGLLAGSTEQPENAAP
ncbi:MAG: MFS transporter [Clostridiaceae bacterium]|nr:MFS transporter [Clostridiaceae bacterium]